MKVFTAEQMQTVDRLTIEGGVPGIVLMHNAGRTVVDFIEDLDGISDDASIVVLAGKGNNGGDGFHIAALLHERGYTVSVFLVGDQSTVTGDARICLDEAVAVGLSITVITDDPELGNFREALDAADVVVDALFGTGLSGDVRGVAADAIDMINRSGVCVVAVDIPSGVDASTGNAGAHAVDADYTVTFGALKAGHLFFPGKALSGLIDVADIGFTPAIVRSTESFGYTLTHTEAALLIPSRPHDAHKGSTGRVFVLAGSVGMTGAATLASTAAMRVGAGLVTVGCPESLNDILEVKLTEVMTLPLPEVRKRRCLSLRALGMIRESVKKADVVAVGPGLGIHSETTELVRRFILGYTGAVILDADGINAFKGKAELLRDIPGKLVLTPHPGELANLTGMSINEIQSDRITAVKRAVVTTGAIVLLKGAPTIICGPSGELWINASGNESMATAGMGDVLTGVIAGFAAQGVTLMDSAVLGAFVHGLAGEAASYRKGIHGVLAGDVLELLPEGLLSILDTVSDTPS